MSTVVFLGPTLAASDAQVACPGVEVRPPAACGDVYRAVRGGARVIGLVDGYFDHQLSVWHKELLWALARDVVVCGAASMGALRAAELAPFGMQGVGQVFEDYRSGLIEADDEVAIVHESAERGYRVRSEALVNVRATLKRGMLEGVLEDALASRLLEIAQSIFYPERTYATLFERARECRLPEVSLVRFERWLGPPASTRAVDQKRQDALALLSVLRALQPAPASASFHFEYTEVWHELVRQLDEEPLRAPLAPPVPKPAIDRPASSERRRTEARHDQANSDAWRVALERALALELARSANAQPNEEATQAMADEFRRHRGLLTPDSTQRWLDERGIDVGSFSLRMRDCASVETFTEQARDLARVELDWLADEGSASNL